MGNLKELSIALLSSTTGVDMTSTSKQTLYTVPSGNTAYVTQIVIVDPTASLAGGTSFSFGSNSAGDNWMSGVDLSSVTTANTGFTTVQPSNGAESIEAAAGSDFGINAATAASASSCTATVMVFGILT